MNNYDNFKPQDEEEKQWVEHYNNLSKFMSEKIRRIDEKDRLQVLKELNPSDLSLMNLFLQALKNEEYETCEVAKAVLTERGFKIPS